MIFRQVILNGELWPYYVSYDGQVLRKKRYNKLKLLKPTPSHKGYLMVKMYDTKTGRKRTVPIHRLVANTFISEKPGKDYQVNHIDGNKLNNRVTNLEWVTCKENINHGWMHGLYKIENRQGEKGSQAKFNNKQIREACEYMAYSDLTYEEISKITGVSEHMLCKIHTGKCWTHISKDYIFTV